MGNRYSAVSYLQILASELSDKMLAEFLDLDRDMVITMHIQSIEQSAAIKMVKGKVSDINKMKIEEQKKAVRSGYDMDIIPSDLNTYSGEAQHLLDDLQSRNERLFLVRRLKSQRDFKFFAKRKTADGQIRDLSAAPRWC